MFGQIVILKILLSTTSHEMGHLIEIGLKNPLKKIKYFNKHEEKSKSL